MRTSRRINRFRIDSGIGGIVAIALCLRFRRLHDLGACGLSAERERRAPSERANTPQMSRHEFDFCVVGAGSAGYAAAVTARDIGKSVALVEANEPLGGLCILRGCM